MKSWYAIWCAASSASPIRASTDAATRNEARSAVVRTKICPPIRSIGRISRRLGRLELARGRRSSMMNAAAIPAWAIAVPAAEPAIPQWKP